MASYILKAKKSLGQHFLHDKNIADRIARAANVKSCNVLEIGPGPGSLTKSILEHGAKKLISIEKDRRCLKELANLAKKPFFFFLLVAMPCVSAGVVMLSVLLAS